MAYSHPFNFLAKLLGAAVGVAVFGGAVFGLDHTPYGPDRLLSYKQPFLGIAYYLALCLGGIFVAWKVVYRPYLEPAGTWLFLKVFRKTRIPWRDCVRLSPLFDPDKSFQWFPVVELPSMREDQRLTYLYGLAIESGRVKPPADPKEFADDYRRLSEPVAAPVITDQSKKSLWRRDLSNRGIGVMTLLFGLGAAYISVISPLLDAAHREKSVTTSLPVTVLTSFCLMIGAAYTILGERSASVLGIVRGQKATPLGYLLMLISAAIGLALYFWLKMTLKTYNYG